MMPSVRVTIDASQVQQRLGSLRAHLDGLRPLLEDIKGRLLVSVQQNFTAGGRPRAWTPLARSTLANRRGTSARILRDTGRLQNSITGRIEQRSVIVGTNVRYARVHQEGGTIQVPDIQARAGKVLRWVTASGQVVYSRRAKAHRVNIPARPYLLLQESDRTYIHEAIGRHLRD
jgi:phage virion morphogenesis protein